MKKFLFLFLFLLFANNSYAALTSAQFATAMGNSATYQAALGLTANVAKTYNPSSYIPKGQVGWYVHNGVDILGPALGSGIGAKVIGSPGSKIITRGAMGLLGPVATAITVGMLINDLYNLSAESPTDLPLLYAATKTGPPDVAMNNRTYSIGDTFAFNGNYYIVTGVGSVEHSSYWYTSAPTISGGLLVIFSDQQTGDTKGGTVHGNGIDNFTTKTSYPFSPYTHVPGPATLENFQRKTASDGPSLDDLYPEYLPEIDKATKKLLDSGDAVTYPTTDQISDLAKLQKSQDSLDAAREAREQAERNYNANPTPENAQILADRIAYEKDKIANQPTPTPTPTPQPEETLVPPDLPSNTYDALITPPDKKSIPELLLSFVSSSPLVSMVKSFTISTSGSACVVPIGNIYGQQLSFDFCRWEPVLAGCGGVLIIIMHGYCILIVVRGW